MATSPLYKSTIIIWSREHPTMHCDLEDLAHKALYGSDTYVSSHRVKSVDDPEADPDWDGTDFFDIPDTGDEGWKSEFPDVEPDTHVESPTARRSHVTELEGSRDDPKGSSGSGESG